MKSAKNEKIQMRHFGVIFKQYGHTYKSELTQYLPIKVCNISTMSINASISRKGDMPLAVSIAIARQNKGGKYHLC